MQFSTPCFRYPYTSVEVLCRGKQTSRLPYVLYFVLLVQTYGDEGPAVTFFEGVYICDEHTPVVFV